MAEFKPSNPTEEFVKNMTFSMFKDFYDAMAARLQLDEPLGRFMAGGVGGLSQKEMTLADNGQLIPAIKELRTRTGLGLREAKELVDNYNQKKHIKPTWAPNGNRGWK